jgi:hypothetical protein
MKRLKDVTDDFFLDPAFGSSIPVRPQLYPPGGRVLLPGITFGLKGSKFAWT